MFDNIIATENLEWMKAIPIIYKIRQQKQLNYSWEFTLIKTGLNTV